MPHCSPSVLVIRLDGIGDALALTPLLAALHARNVPVDIVLRKQTAAVFSSGAGRRIEAAPFALRSNSRTNRAHIDAFGDALRTRDYSDVLVATEDPSGYLLAQRIGAPRRVGFANGLRKPFKTLWVRALLTRTIYRAAALDAAPRHECEILFALGSHLIGEAHPTRDLSRLRPLVLDRDVARDDRIALQVTRKWLQFGASMQDVATLVLTIAREFSLRCIASDSEGAFADAVMSRTGVEVERFPSLEPWKQAIADASALVAPDSGATHVAGMVGTPAVALFPRMRHLERQIARWYPWACPHEALTIEGGWPDRSAAALRTLTSARRA